MRAIAYIRVSTDKQGNSVEAQDRLVRAQAAIKGYDLADKDVITDFDEFSGNLNRPGVQRVIELVKSRSVVAVIVTKLDRLTRSTRDAIDLIELFGKKHVSLISVSESLDTESPMGRFFVRMMASLAELEREMIGTRTAAVMQNLKIKGMPAGTAPYGWKNDNTYAPTEDVPVGKVVSKKKIIIARTPLVENPEEQKIIQRIEELRSESFSLGKIADQLNAEGYRTRSGVPWVYQYVGNVLKSLKAQHKAINKALGAF